MTTGITRFTRGISVRNRRLNLALTVLCLIGYSFHIGFYHGCPWWRHIAYCFSHANVWHLIINLYVLWSIRNKVSFIPAFVIAFVASYLPMYVDKPTMGLSGFLFAAFGIMWGKTGRWKEATRKVMPFVLCTMILPNVNGLLHLWCFWIGYLYAHFFFHKFRF